jgi:hypothetical protein
MTLWIRAQPLRGAEMNLAHTRVRQVEKACDTGVERDIASLQAHMKACERAEWLATLSICMSGLAI